MKRFTGTILAMAALAALMAGAPARAQGIIDDWSSVKPPPPPALKPVTVDPKTTALLLLDFLHQNCSPRPRCVASAAKMEKVAAAAREKGVAVIYSEFVGAKPTDILPGLAPKSGEPIVQGPADKFVGTDLEKILKDKGITTVIVTGTGANGAVLFSAGDAATRGFHVIVPVEGMSSDNLYAEQMAAWGLANMPGAAQKLTLTSIALMKF